MSDRCKVQVSEALQVVRAASQQGKPVYYSHLSRCAEFDTDLVTAIREAISLGVPVRGRIDNGIWQMVRRQRGQSPVLMSLAVAFFLAGLCVGAAILAQFDRFIAEAAIAGLTAALK
jgi:hypothetical protein